MPRVGVSITKSVTFRGVAQEFSNTYYFESGVGSFGSVEGDALIQAVVVLERPMHANTINFVRGRAWTTGGTPGSNQMVSVVPLTGQGTGGSESQAMDRERAFLVRARAGNDSKGRPVYLRKWWHLCLASVNAVGIDNTMLQNTGTLTTAQRSQLETWFNGFKTITSPGGPYVLCAESGRDIDGSTTAHKYLEHHQLGDMWRG